MNRIDRLEAAIHAALGCAGLPADARATLELALRPSRSLSRRQRYPHLYQRPCPVCGQPMHKESRVCARCNPPQARGRALGDLSRAKSDARWAGVSARVAA